MGYIHWDTWVDALVTMHTLDVIGDLMLFAIKCFVLAGPVVFIFWIARRMR